MKEHDGDLCFIKDSSRYLNCKKMIHFFLGSNIVNHSASQQYISLSQVFSLIGVEEKI